MIINKNVCLYVLSLALFCSACKKEQDLNDRRRWFVFLPDRVTTDIPVDLNFDGQSHTNLMGELPIDSSSIYVQWTKSNPVISINWLEPLFNDKVFLKVLPDTLSDTATINYLPAAQQYYYHFANGNSVIVPDTKLVNDNINYYTFEFPDTLYIENDLLTFTSKQNVFVSRKSHRQIILTAVFRKDREEYR